MKFKIDPRIFVSITILIIISLINIPIVFSAPDPPTITQNQSFMNWTYGGYDVNASADDLDGLDDITKCEIYHRRINDEIAWLYNKTGTYNSTNGFCFTNISTSDKNQVYWSRNVTTDE